MFLFFNTYMTGIRLRAPMIASMIGTIKLLISVPTSLFIGQTARNPAKFEAFCNQRTPSRRGGAMQREQGQEPKHRAGGVALPNKHSPPPNIPPKVQASKHSAPQPRDKHVGGITHIEHPEQAHVKGINGREHITQTGASIHPK